jgi:hypothetical protein
MKKENRIHMDNAIVNRSFMKIANKNASLVEKIVLNVAINIRVIVVLDLIETLVL